ncbi:bifunctional demethylmenaquinone methyltransferase/2-methoxy-6-polyprenyl-1,4-benzoquinol methylase UbiE [Porphyromonadaceae sp. NP-X]|jgi:demethylmenaquinone methyltransferase/2-methoxy-6-polyprenyl-1,4-benzoquinol methylase|nr:bifunctional demethylmenaquinone methyltransferase/2-methoxy-6-polyprenyl-1,4-benzoquinol methylase UbiE [Porphyromonadaceae sp. NP-X]NLJ20199.1 bifunctional demethylmenaquinone methyltransferase/2-methoxy-6-polyprenyl-1,4-benzoquinol methylase UbiE [Bacteroidales bacterium]
MEKEKRTNKYTFQEVKPYNEKDGKTEQLVRMFDTIAAQYDKFNDLMSWGFAKLWRKRALSSLKRFHPMQILDVAAGTADMCIKAFRYLNPEKVTGIDISPKMLEIGKEKIIHAGLSEKIELQVMDCSQLSFDNNSFDAVTIAFGVRNFEKLEESLHQIYRVLKPEGHLLILELNEPQKGWLMKGYRLYIKLFVHQTAKYLSSDQNAYRYLTSSMQAFPKGKEMIEILQNNGFKLVKYKKFTFGVCSMYLMEKPTN